MQHKWIWAGVMLTLLLTTLHAQTTFTYQGYLRDGGVPANGNYDFLFRLFDETNTVIGSPIFVNNVVVANGLFTVNLDFGNLFPGAARSLEIRPRQDFPASNNTSTLASFPTVLAPRVSIQRSPYAIFANTAPWSGLSGVPAGFADGIDNDTTYSAGAGLQLAGTTFSIANLGVQTGMIANNAVTNGKIANGAVNDAKISDVAWSKITGAPSSFPPSGAAGGDLGGTYPNPQVTGLTLPINETADVSGNVAFWITNSSSSGLNWGGVFYSAGSGGVGLLAANTSTTGTNFGVVGRADSPDGWAGYFTNRVGIGSFVQFPELSIAASDGDVTFANPQGTITFPATGGANAPMIQMFASGTSNANRMVIAHSPSFTDWGLQYRDSNDTFHFLQGGTSRLSIGTNVGVGVESPAAALHVLGNLRVDSGQFQSWGPIEFRPDVDNSGDDIIRFLNNAGAEMMRVHDNGNVGIGSASPPFKLTVEDTSASPTVLITGSNNSNVDSVLRVENRGNGGRGISVSMANGNGWPGMTLSHEGNGWGGYFSLNSASNIFDAVRGITNGTGRAGYFTVSNSANTSAALEGLTVGTSGIGVRGTATATTGTNYGVYGSATSASGWGVWAQGRLGASGTKSFRIDHPQDPENRYLLHYSSESPEPINFYSGNAVTDSRGYATVSLPSWFESINRDFRYQLTVIGDFAQAIIAEEIKGNQFVIRTDKPRVKVSWRVEAVRNDLWMQRYGAPVEVEKTGIEKGTLLHPELYGQPAEKGNRYQPEHREDR